MPYNAFTYKKGNIWGNNLSVHHYYMHFAMT